MQLWKTPPRQNATGSLLSILFVMSLFSIEAFADEVKATVRKVP